MAESISDHGMNIVRSFANAPMEVPKNLSDSKDVPVVKVGGTALEHLVAYTAEEPTVTANDDIDRSENV